VSACRSCRAPIVWARTVNGKRMPVDRDPTPDGNLVLAVPGVDDTEPYVTVVDPDQPMLDDPPRYRSHYATCPDADRWRKQR
jgi:hypothetical protein